MEDLTTYEQCLDFLLKIVPKERFQMLSSDHEDELVRLGFIEVGDEWECAREEGVLKSKYEEAFRDINPPENKIKAIYHIDDGIAIWKRDPKSYKDIWSYNICKTWDNSLLQCFNEIFPGFVRITVESKDDRDPSYIELDSYADNNLVVMASDDSRVIQRYEYMDLDQKLCSVRAEFKDGNLKSYVSRSMPSGSLHSLSGPAVITNNGKEKYHIYQTKYTKSAWERRRAEILRDPNPPNLTDVPPQDEDDPL